MENLDPKSTIEFMQLVLRLKHSVRKGWEYCKIENPERIAGHMYSMAMMTFLIDSKSNLDRNKCMQLALVHDLAECIVGDITPRDNVPEDIKHKKENDAMKNISSLLGEEMGNHLYSLYLEYEAKSTPEAVFVKDLDRLDMILTAFNYEKRDNTPNKLEEFYESTNGKFEHPFVKKLVNEIYIQRKELCKNSKDSTKTKETAV